MAGKTTVAIRGEDFAVNGEPTYAGRVFEGKRVEGLLFNVRAVQATFDDENWPQTRYYDTEMGRRSFAYPDTCRWDPDRNTTEFCAALPAWRRHGLLAVTLCFQGGRPIKDSWRGRAEPQPWVNVGFTPEGALKPAYAERMARCLDALDHLGMVGIVSFFYFGQSARLRDDEAVKRAVREGTEWLLATGHRNILVEVANEVNAVTSPYHHYAEHPILHKGRVVELAHLAREVSGGRLPLSVSFNGGDLPTPELLQVCDFALLHGNAQSAADHQRMVHKVRAMPAWQANPKPIVFNEAGEQTVHLDAAFRVHASWGYFDFGLNNYRSGYQSPPSNWGIVSAEQRDFFARLAEITGNSIQLSAVSGQSEADL